MNLVIFLFSIIIGSFLNVVIYRLPENKSIVSPPSHCPQCGTRLKAWDLVPILSFLFSKGKCRYCGAKISWQYPVVELLTALLFLGLFVKYGISGQFIIFLLLVSLLIICSFIDLRYKIIPNKITYPGIISGLILSLFFNHITLTDSILGVLIPGGALLLIALMFKGGMGIGDVKLVALVGSFTGWQLTLFAIFTGAIIGTIISIILIIAGVNERTSKIPFGPYISLGVVISILSGYQIIDWYLNLFI